MELYDPDALRASAVAHAQGDPDLSALAYMVMRANLLPPAHVAHAQCWRFYNTARQLMDERGLTAWESLLSTGETRFELIRRFFTPESVVADQERRFRNLYRTFLHIMHFQAQIQFERALNNVHGFATMDDKQAAFETRPPHKPPTEDTLNASDVSERSVHELNNAMCPAAAGMIAQAASIIRNAWSEAAYAEMSHRLTIEHFIVQSQTPPSSS